MQSVQRCLRQTLRSHSTRLYAAQRSDVAAFHTSLSGEFQDQLQPRVLRLNLDCAAQKKKGKFAQEEDLFESEVAEDDDLFGGAASSKSGPSETAGPTVVPIVTSKTTGRSPPDPKRIARFEEERQAVLYRCAPDRDRARPRARQNAVRNMLPWTDTTEQLEAVAELIPALRRAGVTVAEETSRDFIGVLPSTILR